MAYTGTVSIIPKGSLAWDVVITETECGASSEVELVDSTTGAKLPAGVWLQRVIATRSAGTATTRQPRLGVAAAATASQIRYLATATAVGTTIDEAARTNMPVSLMGPRLFHRSIPDAGSDNSFTTIYTVTRRASA